VLASHASSAIKTWNTPVHESIYQNTDDVIYTGTVQIPADWMGRIRMEEWGTFFPWFDQVFFNFDQATKTIPFTMNVGTKSPGWHWTSLRFDGAAECRLVCDDSDLACQQALIDDAIPGNEWCPKTLENQVLDQIYPSRGFTVTYPDDPVLGVSESFLVA
jgi:hypothetical protein